MTNKYVYYNAMDQVIDLVPIAAFLEEFPDYCNALAIVFRTFSKETLPLTPARIQRACFVKYRTAQTMLEVLLAGRAAVKDEESGNISFCVRQAQAEALASHIVSFSENLSEDEDRWLAYASIRKRIAEHFAGHELPDEPLEDWFFLQEGRLSLCRGDRETVEIPQGTVTLGEYSFFNKRKLKDLQIPEGVEKIEKFAFLGCTAMEKIILPSSLKELEAGAFQDCTSLCSIEIPRSVSGVPAYTFEGCTNLAQAVVFATTKVHPDAFPKETKILVISHRGLA